MRTALLRRDFLANAGCLQSNRRIRVERGYFISVLLIVILEKIQGVGKVFGGSLHTNG